MKSLVFMIAVLSIGCGAFASDLDNALSESQVEHEQAYMNLQRFLGRTTQTMYAAQTKKEKPAAADDGMVIHLKKAKKKA